MTPRTSWLFIAACLAIPALTFLALHLVAQSPTYRRIEQNVKAGVRPYDCTKTGDLDGWADDAWDRAATAPAVWP